MKLNQKKTFIFLSFTISILMVGPSLANKVTPSGSVKNSMKDKETLGSSLGMRAQAAILFSPRVLKPSLYFIPNEGQLDRLVDFYVQGRDKHIYFSGQGLTIALSKPEKRDQLTFGNNHIDGEGNNQKADENRANRKRMNGLGQNKNSFSRSGFLDSSFKRARDISVDQWNRWAVKLNFVGASPEARPEGENRTETVVSYFRGQPENWHAGLATYSRIVYRNVWPGVDLAFCGNDNELKYELIVSPGTDPSTIRLSYSGAAGIALNEKGQLEIQTPAGSFVDDAPQAFQIKNGQKISVPVHFEILEKRTETNGLVSSTHTFKVENYDSSLPLIIDPAILVCSGYLGGSSDDRALAITIDSSGNVYITGWTASYDFPVAAGPDLTFNGPAMGTDAFVAKINPSGSSLIYCGYLGGSYNDTGAGIAVDSSGNAYVCGYTFSPDFPVNIGPYTSPNSNVTQRSEAFITKINATGTALTYSGYLGGTSDDLANSVAVDSSGRAYVCGTSDSSDFPTKTGPDITYNGLKDAFVARVAASGASVDWCGFIGGTQDDFGAWIAIDSSGNAYVTGYTASTQSHQFPVKTGPDPSHNGQIDAFVAKVNSNGSSLAYCGYIGGSSDDYGAGIAVDASGNAYVTGATTSATGFPVTVGPDLSYNGGYDAFVAKVNSAGTGLVFCGFLGGSADDFGLSIAVDSSGIAYVAGATDSNNFPVSGGPDLIYNGNRDAFVTTLRADGQSFYYSTFLGGSGWDEANGVAADGTGYVCVAGFTQSPDFPVLVGPFTSPGSPIVSEDCFVTRIYEDLPPAAPENLRLTSITDTEANLAWDDKSGNEDGFKIERKTGAGGTWSQITTVSSNVTTYKNTGLSEATNYYYKVRAYNDIGDSPYSNELSVLTRPAAPTNLTATAIHERRVNLSWTDNSSGEDGFRIERKTGGGSWVELVAVGANATSYPDTGVVESTTYTYRVFAFNSTGDSAASNEEIVTTPVLTIPIAPSSLQAAALSATQVRLTWTDNSYNEDGFKVERKTGASGTWGQVGTAGAEATTYMDSGLSELTTYYYRVRAYNNAGDSDYSNEALITTPENKPKLRVPVADIVFGNMNVCSSADRTTVLYNDGGAELLVSSISRASGSTGFSYFSPAVPFTVPPFSSRTITVRFAPGEVGAASAVFSIASNDQDNPTTTFSASGNGFIPVITISLEVETRTERAWIIRRDYGRLTIVVNKEAPFTVSKYRLWRKISGGSYELRKEFSEGDFSYDRLVYIDKYLDRGKSYLYRVEALDCANRVIASSDEVGPQPQAVPARKVERPRKIIK
jgi:hypothetical protein